MGHDTVIFNQRTLNKVEANRRRLLSRSTEEDLPTLRLTARDIAIINACYEYRALSAPQLQQLFFQKSNNNRSQQAHCQHRLKLLYHHGYLYRDEPKTKLSEGRRPLIYFLDKKGAGLLAECFGTTMSELDWNPKDNTAGAGYLFLDHLLKTNDVRIAVTQAAQHSNALITKWLDDKTLKSSQMREYVNLKNNDSKTQKVAVVPDGYFSLEVGDGIQQHLFIEADLRTMVGQSSISGKRDWKRKIRVYLAFHSQKLFRKRYNARSFRVLTVTTGQGRLENLKKITEEAGGKNRFWFTTFDQINANTALTEPIWQIAQRQGKFSLLETPTNEEE